MHEPEQLPDDRDVGAWADAYLEQHRDRRSPGRDPAPPWYAREMPKLKTAENVLWLTGFIGMCVAGYLVIEVMFNSG